MLNMRKMLRNSTRTRYRIYSGSLLFFVAYLCLICLANPAIADVTWSGSVSPADPTTWTGERIYGTYAYIGRYGDGTINVTGDSDISSYRALIGDALGATGTATVDGPVPHGRTVVSSLSAKAAWGC